MMGTCGSSNEGSFGLNDVNYSDRGVWRIRCVGYVMGSLWG